MRACAVIDTSPLRTRRIFASTNPPRFANVVVGGGVTPFVGCASAGRSRTAAGSGPARARRSPQNRDATIVTIESEFSFRYTKLLGEWVRDTLETSSGDAVASGWYVQGAADADAALVRRRARRADVGARTHAARRHSRSSISPASRKRSASG